MQVPRQAQWLTHMDRLPEGWCGHLSLHHLASCVSVPGWGGGCVCEAPKSPPARECVRAGPRARRPCRAKVMGEDWLKGSPGPQCGWVLALAWPCLLSARPCRQEGPQDAARTEGQIDPSLGAPRERMGLNKGRKTFKTMFPAWTSINFPSCLVQLLAAATAEKLQ